MNAFRTLLCFGVLTTGLLGVASATAQEKKTAPAPQGSDAAAAKAFMEKFVGDWDALRIFYGPGGGEPKKSKGTCKQSIQYNGKWLISEFAFGEGADKITGQGVLAYVPDTGLFISNWFDSRQAKMSVRQSKEKFNGKQIELSTIPFKLDKSARASRTVTIFEDNDKKIIHRQWNMLDDGEKLWMELHMTRK